MLRKEHLQMLENNRDMVQGMKMREVDLINYQVYVQEFYDKMKDMYFKDYETRIKDLEAINLQMAEKRLHYAHFKDLKAPKEDPLAKVSFNKDRGETSRFFRYKSIYR
jgi:hypothetical protein